MRVYFKANKYRPVAPFSSWIYTIASNLAKTELKKMKRYSHVALDDIQSRLPDGAIASENPESSGLTKNVKRALELLHPRYRIPVILKELGDFNRVYESGAV